jgi:hypothetical protein
MLRFLAFAAAGCALALYATPAAAEMPRPLVCAAHAFAGYMGPYSDDKLEGLARNDNAELARVLAAAVTVCGASDILDAMPSDVRRTFYKGVITYWSLAD